MAGPLARTVADLAAHLGGVVVDGPDEALLSGVRPLAEAQVEHLSFLANPRYAPLLATTQAGAVLVRPGVRRPTPTSGGPRTVIEVDDPYAAFARALRGFHPAEWPDPGRSPQAFIHETAVVDGATVEAFAWVGPGAVVGPGTWLEAGAVVGPGATVGRDCRLMAHSVVCAGCTLGDRVWLNPHAVVGAEGFGFAPTGAGHVKIPQVGRAVVEDDVELGAHAAVDRAALGETRVGRGTKTDNFVQVGHAAAIGPGSLMVAYAGVAGSSRLGAGTVLAARSSVLGHLELGDGVQVGVASVVHNDQPAGARVSGTPAIPHRRWLRAANAQGELPALLRTVRRLEARVEELEARLAADEDD